MNMPTSAAANVQANVRTAKSIPVVIVERSGMTAAIRHDPTDGVADLFDR
jgi:hypothetical protein